MYSIMIKVGVYLLSNWYLPSELLVYNRMQVKFYILFLHKAMVKKWILQPSFPFLDFLHKQIVKNHWNNCFKFLIKIVKVHLVLKNSEKFAKKWEKDLMRHKLNKWLSMLIKMEMGESITNSLLILSQSSIHQYDSIMLYFNTNVQVYHIQITKILIMPLFAFHS